MAQAAPCLRRDFGLALLTYLYDIYIRGPRVHRNAWAGGLAAVYVVGQLRSARGFSIHILKKSGLWPAPALLFLGLTVDYGRFTVPHHRTDSIIGLAQAFLAGEVVTSYQLETLLGKAQSTYLAFTTAAFFTRAMQAALLHHRYRVYRHPVVGLLRAELEFWAGVAGGTQFVAGSSAPWLSPAHITVVIGAATLGAAFGSAVAFSTKSPSATVSSAGMPWPGSSLPPASTPRAWVILATVLWYFLVDHPSIEAPDTWPSESSCHLGFVVPTVRSFQLALSSPAFLEFVRASLIPEFLLLLRATNLRLTVRRARNLASYGLEGSRDGRGGLFSGRPILHTSVPTMGTVLAEAFASPFNARLYFTRGFHHMERRPRQRSSTHYHRATPALYTPILRLPCWGRGFISAGGSGSTGF
jgi:hypothetical protein